MVQPMADVHRQGSWPLREDRAGMKLRAVDDSTLGSASTILSNDIWYLKGKTCWSMTFPSSQSRIKATQILSHC